MTKFYKEMQVLLTDKDHDPVFNALYLNDIKNILEEESSIKIYYPEREIDKLKKLRTFLIDNVGLKGSNIIVSDLEDKNWNEEWEKSIEPVYIKDKIIIYPSWKKHQLKDSNDKIQIEIDPKMSFGTGHNETTQLVLEMMCDFLEPNDKYMLDFGCGTGVLSIAGIKLGLVSVIAIDIDEEAIENAKDYSKINNVSEFVKLYKKTNSEVKETGFDVICANIVRSVIEENLKIISNKLKRSGKLLLSGILTEEESKICNALSKYGFKVVEKYSKADWLGIYALKKE